MPAPSAPQPIATQRKLSLQTVTQGKRRIYRVSKFDVKGERKTKVENEIGNDAGAGFVRTPGGFTLSMTAFEQKGKSWPDWDALEDSQEECIFTDQIVGGRRVAYGPCVVSSVDRSGEKDGGHDVTIEIVSLDRGRL